MKVMAIAMVLAFAGGSAVAFAAERSITQKGRAFSDSAVTVKKGDTLVFVNDDTVGNEFNLGSQMPGATSNVTLNNPGEVSVVCAIHPRMKMTVTVE